MNKPCKNCNQGFEITDDDLKFLDKVSPVFGGKKYEIDPPTLCPQCRQQRRLAICNEQFLYPGECGMCKKRTITEYPPHLNKPIYCRECWHSDKWDSADYGKDIDLGSYKQCQEFKKIRKEVEKNHCFKEYQGHNLQDSLGDHLINCKEAKFCFDCEDVESAKYCFQLVLGAKNVQDVYQYGTNLQESYECSISGENSYHLLFCDNCHMSSADLLYCWYMEASKNCFTCVGMMRKSYCILNKQYTKEQYEELVPKIIEHMKTTGEWGEFFPTNISPFGYNKSSAQMYYPLTKEKVLSKGLKWDDYETPVADVKNTILAKDLPDNIAGGERWHFKFCY